MASVLERNFQAKLIKELKELFEGCIVMKMDAGQIQGIPDLLILWNDKWAALECKKSAKAKRRPNQQYYIKKLNNMSFARFIFPENKQEVLNDLQRAFGVKRKTCTIQSFSAGVAKVRRKQSRRKVV